MRYLSKAVAALTPVLVGCATIANPGKSVHIQPTPDGPYVKVARVPLRGVPALAYAAQQVDGITVPLGFRAYSGDALLEIKDAADSSFAPGMQRICKELERSEQLGVNSQDALRKAADIVALSRSTERQRVTSFRQLFPYGCDVRYVWMPYLELDKSRQHALRFVAQGTEATVYVKPRFHMRWIFANWVWATGAPIGWAIDGLTGNWTYFDEVNVAEALNKSRSIGAR